MVANRLWINFCCFVSVQVCDYERHVLARIKCPMSLPYCVEGQCGSQPSKQCSEIPIVPEPGKRSELCPAAGFYPDPTQCNRFNLCDAKLRAIPYMCPEYYVYDPLTNLCKTFTQNHDCPVLDCQLYINRFASYPLDRSLYAFCGISDGRPIVSLYQCPSETFFDPETQSCVFGCIEGEGKFAHPEDRSKYYLCLRNQLNQVGECF